jgi:arginase family enzyme
MNISIIGMPLFYGCDNPGVEKGPEELRKNNLKKNLKKSQKRNQKKNLKKSQKRNQKRNHKIK